MLCRPKKVREDIEAYSQRIYLPPPPPLTPPQLYCFVRLFIDHKSLMFMATVLLFGIPCNSYIAVVLPGVVAVVNVPPPLLWLPTLTVHSAKQ